MLREPVAATGAEANFSEDDKGAQGALGVIVGGRPVVFEEGKELLIFGRAGNEALAEGFGFGKSQWLSAEGIESGAEAGGEILARLGGGGKRRFAGVLEKRFEALAETHGGSVGFGDEGEFFADFPALAQQMGQAALAASGTFEAL